MAGDDVKENDHKSGLVSTLMVFLSSHTRILLTGLACIAIFSVFQFEPSEKELEFSFAYLWHVSSIALYYLLYVVKDFGIALVVVFGVALLVEGPARDRLDEYNKKITKNALTSFLETSLPPEFFDYLRHLATDAKFVRDDLEVSVTVSPIEGDSEHVLVEYENHYYLSNHTDKEQKYEVSAYIEKPVSKGFDDYPKCTRFFVDGVAKFENDLFAADKEWADTDLIKRYRHELLVPGGKRVRVRISCTTVKFSRDHFVWSSIHPASSLQVSVEVPENYESFVSILHPECLTETISGGAARGATQKVRKPVMPGTAAEIVWNPA